jgi:hypothetical protein
MGLMRWLKRNNLMGTYVEKQGIYIPSICHKTVKKKKKGVQWLVLSE